MDFVLCFRDKPSDAVGAVNGNGFDTVGGEGISSWKSSHDSLAYETVAKDVKAAMGQLSLLPTL